MVTCGYWVECGCVRGDDRVICLLDVAEQHVTGGVHAVAIPHWVFSDHVPVTMNYSELPVKMLRWVIFNGWLGFLYITLT